MSSLKRVEPRPIICVCEERDRVGIILRSDYDAASREHWKSVIDGTNKWNPSKWNLQLGIRLQCNTIFVFPKYSIEHSAIVRRCFVERAVFEIPRDLPGTTTQQAFDRATQHIFGYTMDKERLKDEMYFGKIPPDQVAPMDLQIRGLKNWMDALPSHIESKSEGIVPVERFFFLDWQGVHQAMFSPPSIENLIISFFIFDDGYKLEELVCEDTDEPELGLLTWIKEHPSYSEPAKNDSERTMTAYALALYRARFMSSVLQKETDDARTPSLLSSSGPLINKRFILHKVVLSKPQK